MCIARGNPKISFNEFIVFKENNKQYFTNKIIDLIWKTSCLINVCCKQ
ncbi:hypothetical protein T190607A02C_50017 [Tenacibaculum sp. 190524A02b]